MAWYFLQGYSVSLGMNKMILTGCITLFISHAICAQPVKPIRYKEYIFSDIAITKNISYSAHIPTGIKEKYYQLDLYHAMQDSSTRRPLIIWMHGGGFKFGSKKAKGIRLWSKSFARRGYVCAAINYRLSKKNPLRNFPALVKGCYEAIQDVTQAIAFFKKKCYLIWNRH